MLAKVSLVSVLCLIMMSVATPTGTTVTKTVTATAPAITVTAPASACDASNLQCCNSLETAQSAIAGGGLSLAVILAILSGGLQQNVGKTCSPLSILGGGTCSKQTLCCSNNQFGGLISLGCIPINIGL